MSKRIYNNPDELVGEIQDGIEKINANSKSADSVRLVLRQAMLRGLVEYGEYYRIRSQLKPRKIRPDIYVPQDDEVKKTLAGLEEHHRLTYLVLLYSGVRVSETQYLFDHKNELKVQEFDGFVKVTLDWTRGSKTALFVYLPIELYHRIGKAQNELSGLQARIKKLDLIPLKYCRKWFAQKCLEAGIKPEVVDFYQGRSPRTVLMNHYVNLKVFADKDYEKAAKHIERALGNIAPATLAQGF